MADNKQDADQNVRISYPASNDYKVVHANGAYGGITPDGTEIKFDLYQEYSQPLEYETRQIHGVKMGDTISKQPATPDIVRERVVGVVMTLDKAKVLANWMIEKIQKFEEELDLILKQMGDEENEQVIQSEQLGPESTE